MKFDIKKVLPWFILTALVFGFIGYKITVDKRGINVAIGNETNKKIEGLKLMYENITEDISIPGIEPNVQNNIKLEPKEDFKENQLKIYYLDKSGVVHDEVIVPSFKKSENMTVYVRIKEINENGVIDFEVKVDK
ncbi:hypothetical protein SAMN02745163_00593 [Clostridium cavendishii DSM 21758]|uniref:Uncharacterized protein n=1 Tax=Clostridium cavendishii DSM 21758 TaxID=1121302 RepID=A0A1M6CZU0_9CLOT|nr:hypothetical protein [Clostridium cavendishii]SHI66248.1 hypothetical protein SAMN02745163_00593 [Clostridium cavendishii DSM 21758]